VIWFQFKYDNKHYYISDKGYRYEVDNKRIKRISRAMYKHIFHKKEKGTIMDTLRSELKQRAQAVCDNKLEVLEFFIDDDIDQLYTMIMENMGIDEYIDEMSHRVYELDDVYYILEEDDMLAIQNIEKGEKI
jgi:hypothetical protein